MQQHHNNLIYLYRDRGGREGEGRGGEGGGLLRKESCRWEGGEVNQQSTWKGSARTLQGLPLTMLILGGQSTLNLERICEHIARITSDNVDAGGGWLTLNLERICEDIARITSDNVNPGAGSIDTQLGKDPWGHCKDCLWQCWSWGVNWHSTWKGFTRTLQGLPLTMLILGVNQHSTWKGSVRTLQGLPLTMLILERLINTQLEKGPQGHCKDYLW